MTRVWSNFLKVFGVDIDSNFVFFHGGSRGGGVW